MMLPNPPPSLAEVRSALEVEGKKRRSMINLTIGTLIGLALLYGLLFLSQIAFGKEPDFSILTSQVALIGCFASAWGLSQNHKWALTQTKMWQDPALTPHLLEVLDTNEKEFQSVCRSVLQEVLPKLQPEHAPLFTSQQLKTLMRLAKKEKPQLAEAAVRALGKVGDRRTPEELEKFASMASQSNPSSSRLAALALQAAGDLRLEQARKIVSDRVQAMASPRPVAESACEASLQCEGSEPATVSTQE